MELAARIKKRNVDPSNLGLRVSALDIAKVTHCELADRVGQPEVDAKATTEGASKTDQ
jgi:hypothetical protein